jgi:radical SAM-linked protein
MIGLPTETETDVEGIVQVGKNALAVGRKHCGGRAKVTVSVSTHVPKPHTPFQWAAMDSLPQIRAKQEILRLAARGAKNLTLRTHDAKTSVIEGVLARGDRRLSYVIEYAFLRGAVFDSWEEHFRLDLWHEAFEHFGVDISVYLGTLPVTARLPWDHFDLGLEEGFLLREYQKALQSRLSPPCGKVKGMFIHHTNRQEAVADERKLVCYDCGVACDLTQMRNERIDFLTRMGASEPAQRAHLPVLREATRADNLPGPERLRPARSGGVPQRWRLRFEKTGAAALLGHLDLLRELPRVVRRAGVRTHYSQGFHPKPAISFGPALSLGVASFDEYVDVQLLGVQGETELLTALNRAASPGLRFTACRPLGAREPNVNTLITGARYWIGVPRRDVARWGGEALLRQKIEEFLASSKVVVVRRVKGIARNVDVRERVLELRCLERDVVSERVGLMGDFIALEVTVSITPQGAIKVSEVVEALFGSDAFPFRAVRLALLSQHATPYDATIGAAANLPQPPELGSSFAAG